MIDVMAYGAVGDGLEDDSAAIERAIRAATEQGAAVCFPLGRTFRITRLLREDNPQPEPPQPDED